jgi:hypothetical protein
MKDIPVFTTDYGVSSLILKEIPYKQLAFILVQDVQPGQLKPHLEECISFCRMVGAEKILAKGHGELENYPLESVVVEMTLLPQQQEPEANLWPVTEETVTKWREIYNNAMGQFANHATLTFHDEKRIVQSGGAYFVHRDGTLLGIGWMDGQELLALVSTVSGMGETVARTLFTTVGSDPITLEVVSDNLRAVRLYERMGFVKTREVSRWYRLL